MKTENITDYASFLQAKYALKAEIENERDMISFELKKGMEELNPSGMVAGFAEKVIDSPVGQKITSVLSMVSFVKDIFGKKKKHDET